MTLKARKFREKKSAKIWGNILNYFQNFSAKILEFGQKTTDFTTFWKN